MSIYKINENLSTAKKLELINNMVLELAGEIEQTAFNKIEVSSLYTNLGIYRQYIRNRVLGNTLTTYTNWTHLLAETGYSIWKITPDTYAYDTNNEVYFDNKQLVNMGLANSETATSFDKVFFYNGDSGSGYTDDTTEASTDSGTEFSLMNSTNDYIYLGDAATFTGSKFEFQTRGSGYTLKIEYYSEESGVNAWVELTANIDDLVDNTSNFESDGLISWSLPANWGLTTVNGQNLYWIRLSTTTTPTTAAKAYYIIPGDSVVGLLSLSSEQILEEEWSWCTYGSSVYITIRNTGDSAYEGDYYVTSSSSTTNKQNYFIYNHTYSSDYKDSTYTQGDIVFYFGSPTTDGTWRIIKGGNDLLVQRRESAVYVTKGTFLA